MTPFHNGLNHWQRQWLSDQLHKKHPSQTEPIPVKARTKKKPPE
jgi:hypothetical protein